MRNKIGDRERLGHILDYSELIEKSLVGVSEKDFYSNFILQAALQKWIEILGEACYQISKEFKSEHSNIDWVKIQGLRHVLVHEYFGIDLLRIWEIAQHYVPELKETVSKLYKEFK
jgi:uncharacterized protein with HEPN domain